MHNYSISGKTSFFGAALLFLTAITVVSGLSAWQEDGPGRDESREGSLRITASPTIPLIFEKNQGQAAAGILYRALSPYYAVDFTRQGALVKIGRQQGTDLTLAIRPIGANPSPSLSGERLLPGRHHYLNGRDPSQWRRDIPTYAAVRYQAVYPGIDMLFRGNENRLEYDFIVTPGADPAAIQLQFPGADDMRIDGDGALRLSVAGRQITQPPPVIYQEAGDTRTLVIGGYTLDAQRRVGFTIAAYDPALPLVIDPVLVYASFMGGSGDDKSFDLALDNAGNIYIAGSTNSPDLPTTGGALDSACGSDGNCDAAVSGGTTILNTDFFVTKLDPSGAPVYTTYLGGSQSDVATGIVVNGAGEAYLSGYTASADFPTTPGAFDPACTDTSPADGFCDEGVEATVVKLNASGNNLLYSTYLGGNGDDYARAIAIDGTGAAYVTGDTASGDFPMAPGVFAGEEDVFAAKLDAAGSTLLYATYVGGIGTDIGLDIAVDTGGNAYLTGFTASADFPVTAGALDTLCGSTGACDGLVDDNNDGVFETIFTFDAFVTKLDGSGMNMLYSTYLGGERYDHGNAITVDSAGNAYVAGETRSNAFPPALSTTAYQNAIAGSYDGYLARLNAAGTALDFFTYIGGTHGDTVSDLAVAPDGGIHLLGSTFSRDFPVLAPFQNPPPQRQDDTVIVYDSDAWLARFNADASTLRASSTFGGQHNDYGTALGVGGDGKAYLTGYTVSVDMPVTSMANQSTHGNEIPGDTVAGVDSYIAIVSQGDGDLAVSLAGDPETITQGQTVTYQAVVTNIGTVDAEGVRLDYEIIKDTSPVTATPSQGSCGLPAARVSCDLGMLAANGGSATVTFTIAPNGAENLVNHVAVSARMSDSDPGNNSASVTTTVKSISFAAGPDQDDHGHHDGHDDGSGGGGLGLYLLAGLLLYGLRGMRRIRPRDNQRADVPPRPPFFPAPGSPLATGASSARNRG